MRRIWVVLPVKVLAQTKSRLMDVLSPRERADLTRSLVERTLSLLHCVPEVRGTIIVSRDAEISKIGAQFGARCIGEPAQSGLNTAVTTGYQLAAQEQAAYAFILPSDLPLLEPADVTAVCQLADPTRVVIAPDKVEDGTNALLLPTGLHFWFRYGRASYHKHLHEARRNGLTPHIVKRPNLQFDLDTGQDFSIYQNLQNNKIPQPFGTIPTVPDSCPG